MAISPQTAISNRNLAVAMMLVSILICGTPLRADADHGALKLSDANQQRCLKVLRESMKSEEFWPSMHAAEALTFAGYTDEVRSALSSRLASETDDQRRCGLAREMVRAGDLTKIEVLLKVLADPKSNGHVHAAESLYKITQIGDGSLLREHFQKTDNDVLKVMAAAALARCGSTVAIQSIRDNLSNKDVKVAMLAAWVLGTIGGTADIPAIKSNQSRATEPLARCYFEHACARLGDAEGQKALLQNLKSDNTEIRASAATFAGKARMFQASNRLIELLDDSDRDVRIRAAQSLLTLAQ